MELERCVKKKKQGRQNFCKKYYLNLHILAEVAKLKFLNSETDRGVVRAPNTQNFCWLVVVPCLRNSHTEEILGINHRAA